MGSKTVNWKKPGLANSLSRAGLSSQTQSADKKGFDQADDQEPTSLSNRVSEFLGREAEKAESARRTTISVALDQSCHYSEGARWKPLLSKRHMKTHMEFVSFSGLMKQKLNFSARMSSAMPVKKTSIAHHILTYTLLTVKYGAGSIILWGCFLEVGTGTLVRINRAQQKEALAENLLKCAQNLIPRQRFTFQHDNNISSTRPAKITLQWLHDKSLNVLEWTRQCRHEPTWKSEERPEDCSSPTPPIKSDRAWNCEEEWEKLPKIQICKAGKGKMIQNCNCCQRQFFNVLNKEFEFFFRFTMIGYCVDWWQKNNRSG